MCANAYVFPVIIIVTSTEHSNLTGIATYSYQFLLVQKHKDTHFKIYVCLSQNHRLASTLKIFVDSLILTI